MSGVTTTLSDGFDDYNLEDYWKAVRVPPALKTFRGYRDSANHAVVVVSSAGARSKKLPLYLRVLNHSPSGFEWGYSGSGPAQLALAILLNSFPEESKDWAIRLHQFFKARIVASLPRTGWTLTSDEIKKAVDAIVKERLGGVPSARFGE